MNSAILKASDNYRGKYSLCNKSQSTHLSGSLALEASK